MHTRPWPTHTISPRQPQFTVSCEDHPSWEHAHNGRVVGVLLVVSEHHSGHIFLKRAILTNLKIVVVGRGVVTAMCLETTQELLSSTIMRYFVPTFPKISFSYEPCDPDKLKRLKHEWDCVLCL